MHAKAAIVMHYTGNDWVAAQVNGLQHQFANMGVDVVAVTDANFQPQQQIADIDAVLAHQPNLIVSIPTDPVLTADAYRKAAAQGVKIVFMDNVPKGLVQGSDYVGVVSADNYGNGVTSAQIMGQQLGGHGKIGLVYHDADFLVTRQRYDAFKRTVEDEYPNIEIVAEAGVTGPDFAAQAERVAAAMLAEHPDLRGIWAVWDVPAQGVLQAIRRAGRSDVIVTTIDLGRTIAAELAQNEIVKGVGAQRVFDHGVTEAILAGYALLGEDAPTDVVFPGLPVTKNNLLDAWRTVYREDPPAEVRAAFKQSR